MRVEFFVLVFSVLITLQGAMAFPGEVVQIDHDNLRNFSSIDQTCFTYGNYAFYPVWFYADYAVNKQVKRVAIKLQGGCYIGNVDPCAQAQADAYNQLASLNQYFNDIKRNNLTISSERCVSKYVVATLNQQIQLGEGTSADNAVFSYGNRVVACP